MLRKLAFLLGVVAIMVVPARAQDKIELSASYSYMHFSATPAVNLNGAELGGQYKIADWLGVAADLTGEYGKVGGVSSQHLQLSFWTTGYVAAADIAVRARAIGRRAF